MPMHTCTYAHMAGVGEWTVAGMRMVPVDCSTQHPPPGLLWDSQMAFNFSNLHLFPNV